MTKPSTPWSRVTAYLKDWEVRQNNDGGAGTFAPPVGDVRQVIEEHTEACTIITGLLRLIPAQPSDDAPSMWPENAREFLKRQGA